MASRESIPQFLWGQQVPLLITYAGTPNLPFVTYVPRFSYLALLRPRLCLFFRQPVAGSHCSSFHHEDVLLRNLPVGLLVDLYRPTLPWRLTVRDDLSWDIGDTFLNSAKEADFIRNGNAHRIMSLSKDDTTALWNSVKDNDYTAFNQVNSRLLNSARGLKNVPIRIYIPQSPEDTAAAGGPAGSFKVVQPLVSPRVSERTPKTLGAALHGLLPLLFPSSRDPVLANVILNGARVPFRAPLEELMQEAAYPDGWLYLVVVPLDI
ncbi:autophagy protein Apg5-domain-containing protein [Xylariomycetidae sp. FL0641]|nr:autophagy protein Apg5-domain-containing protein [Xylariomycetidae sp. FL0641]